ncbi:MAG: hypothetical protein AB3N22_03725, partial [Ruegeria sp.]
RVDVVFVVFFVVRVAIWTVLRCCCSAVSLPSKHECFYQSLRKSWQIASIVSKNATNGGGVRAIVLTHSAPPPRVAPLNPAQHKS